MPYLSQHSSWQSAVQVFVAFRSCRALSIKRRLLSLQNRNHHEVSIFRMNNSLVVFSLLFLLAVRSSFASSVCICKNGGKNFESKIREPDTDFGVVTTAVARDLARKHCVADDNQSTCPCPESCLDENLPPAMEAPNGFTIHFVPVAKILVRVYCKPGDALVICNPTQAPSASSTPSASPSQSNLVSPIVCESPVQPTQSAGSSQSPAPFVSVTVTPTVSEVPEVTP